MRARHTYACGVEGAHCSRRGLIGRHEMGKDGFKVLEVAAHMWVPWGSADDCFGTNLLIGSLGLGKVWFY